MYMADGVTQVLLFTSTSPPVGNSISVGYYGSSRKADNIIINGVVIPLTQEMPDGLGYGTYFLTSNTYNGPVITSGTWYTISFS